MSAHVLLNLLNKLGKRDLFFATSLINSIIQEHECLVLLIICFFTYLSVISV